MDVPCSGEAGRSMDSEVIGACKKCSFCPPDKHARMVPQLHRHSAPLPRRHPMTSPYLRDMVLSQKITKIPNGRADRTRREPRHRGRACRERRQCRRVQYTDRDQQPCPLRRGHRGSCPLRARRQLRSTNRANRPSLRHQLGQQLDPLGHRLGRQDVDTREVTARPSETSDQSCKTSSAR